VTTLVTAASKHEATWEIAQRIGGVLGETGIEVTVLPVEVAEEPDRFEAAVIGSAIYYGKWLEPARRYVERYAAMLRERPVWLFSSGPLGTDTVDAEGRDVLTTTEPKEFAEFREAIHPRGTQIFFGAWDPSAPPIGLMERMTRLMPAARDALPAGDFRDWAAIDAWAGSIADELALVPAGSR
jgi:menaquinone-dependent protoporphyrinogen oxidase